MNRGARGPGAALRQFPPPMIRMEPPNPGAKGGGGEGGLVLGEKKKRRSKKGGYGPPRRGRKYCFTVRAKQAGIEVVQFPRQRTYH